MSEVKIRKLTIKDRKRLTALIDNLIDKTDDKSFANIISSASSSSSESKRTDGDDSGNHSNASAIQVGIQVLRLLLVTLEEETSKWFSELINVSCEEFESLPIDTEMIILEQIVESEEANNFFTIALRLRNKMQKLFGQQGKMKTK